MTTADAYDIEQGGLTVDRSVHIGFTGCGPHATRNIYPVLRLATMEGFARSEPIGDLVDCCHLDQILAKRNAKTVGFRQHHTEDRAMLEHVELDCDFSVVHPWFQGKTGGTVAVAPLWSGADG